MNFIKKKCAYYIEKYAGITIGIVLSVFVYNLNPTFSIWKPILKEFPAIGMCAFGFLLTFLSIILQGSSETILWMKSRKTLFQRFISFNKRIVILSLFLSFFSFFIYFFNIDWFATFFTSSFLSNNSIKECLISLFVCLITWFVYDLIYFIKLFYLLIKK